MLRPGHRYPPAAKNSRVILQVGSTFGRLLHQTTSPRGVLLHSPDACDQAVTASRIGGLFVMLVCLHNRH